MLVYLYLPDLDLHQPGEVLSISKVKLPKEGII